jgi:hypothetical protein
MVERKVGNETRDKRRGRKVEKVGNGKKRRVWKMQAGCKQDARCRREEVEIEEKLGSLHITLQYQYLHRS